ncbi:MAG TPA: hypothetical protein VNR65_05740, partial [Geobacterales bacterium]|nr:hypothetical protein [Geobacterales bacterium]
KGTNVPPVRYEAASRAKLLDGGAMPQSCKVCSGGEKVPLGGERLLTFRIAPIKKATFLQIEYTNLSPGPLPVQLRVDSQMPTNLSLPPTGPAGEVGSVTIEVETNQPGSLSTLTFSSPVATGPALVAVSVLGAH